jgi:OOP family OmpA-OmpF porin
MDAETREVTMNRAASRMAWMLFCLLPVTAWSGSGARYVDPQAPGFRWPAVDLDADGVFDRLDRCADTKLGCSVDAWGCASDRDRDGVCDGRDQCPRTPLRMKVDGNGCHAGAQAVLDPRASADMPREITRGDPASLQFPSTAAERQLIERGRFRLESVYFETASAVLLAESEAVLDEVGTALARFPDLTVEVEGHTDTRGSARSNQSLSQARAQAVRDYLVRRFRLRAENVTARGYGESRPETRERSAEELLRNRRVELRVLNAGALPGYVRSE